MLKEREYTETVTLTRQEYWLLRMIVREKLSELTVPRLRMMTENTLHKLNALPFEFDSVTLTVNHDNVTDIEHFRRAKAEA